LRFEKKLSKGKGASRAGGGKRIQGKKRERENPANVGSQWSGLSFVGGKRVGLDLLKED